jgi:hypothetical protein
VFPETAAAEFPVPTAKSPKKQAPKASTKNNNKLPAAEPKLKPQVTRVEKDTMGEMEVPVDVLYGASTQRAVLNFPVSGRPVPSRVIKAYALLKAACATVNCRLKRLDADRTRLIVEACHEIRDGLSSFGGLAKHFPIDIFQTGSGTSTNMNANEVVSNIICLRPAQAHRIIKGSRVSQGGRGSPQRPREHGAEFQRHIPDRDAHRGGAFHPERAAPGDQGDRDQAGGAGEGWDKLVKIGGPTSRMPRRSGWVRSSRDSLPRCATPKSGCTGRCTRCRSSPSAAPPLARGSTRTSCSGPWSRRS